MHSVHFSQSGLSSETKFWPRILKFSPPFLLAKGNIVKWTLNTFVASRRCLFLRILQTRARRKRYHWREKLLYSYTKAWFVKQHFQDPSMTGVMPVIRRISVVYWWIGFQFIISIFALISQILDHEQEVCSTTGKSHAVIPAFTFYRDRTGDEEEKQGKLKKLISRLEKIQLQLFFRFKFRTYIHAFAVENFFALKSRVIGSVFEI